MIAHHAMDGLPFQQITVVPDLVPVMVMSRPHLTAAAALESIDCPSSLMQALLTALDVEPVALVSLPTFEAEGGSLPAKGPWHHGEPAETLIAVFRATDGQYYLGVGLAALATTSETHADEIATSLAQAIGRPVIPVRRARFTLATQVVLQ